MKKRIIKLKFPMFKVTESIKIYKLSNKNKFTKWGFFKQIILSSLLKDWSINIAKVDNKFAGFIFIRKNFIYRICVDKKYQGQGIGNKLIPSYAKSTETNRKKAVKFWKENGFRLIGYKKGVWKFEKARVINGGKNG